MNKTSSMVGRYRASLLAVHAHVPLVGLLQSHVVEEGGVLMTLTVRDTVADRLRAVSLSLTVTCIKPKSGISWIWNQAEFFWQHPLESPDKYKFAYRRQVDDKESPLHHSQILSIMWPIIGLGFFLMMTTRFFISLFTKFDATDAMTNSRNYNRTSISFLTGQSIS